MKKLEKFIKDNKLTFSGEGSALNSECCIIAGYADHLGIEDYDPVKSAITAVNPEASGFEDELERVMDFAWDNSYGNFWKTKEAKLQYKF